MSHRLARAIAAVACLSAVSLTGCVSQDMANDLKSSRTHGVNVDVTNGTKVRNIVIVATGDGKGVLEGQLTSGQDVQLTGVSGSATDAQGVTKPLVITGGKAQVKAGVATKLADQKTTLTAPTLRPGLLADLTLTFSDGATATAQVPVVSAEHEDYATPTQG